MSVSMKGLDLDFLKDPANRLPPREPKERIDTQAKRATGIAIPYFLSDIKPFVSVAARDPVEITSRSVLRQHEIDHGIRQVGNDIKPGSIVEESHKRQARINKLIEGVPNAWT